jgi:hypothetical protein
VTKRVSAVESISPAFARTKQMLFRPFHFGLWARLAVVALITGEAGGVGGGGGSIPNFNTNRGGDNHWARHLANPWASRWSDRWAGAAHLFSASGWEEMQPYFGLIVLGVGLALAVMLLWIYSDCIYRFILLDAVVSGQCRLREGWRRWRDAGRRYFLWVVAFGFGSSVLMGVMVGVPVLLAYRAGWFEKPDQNLGALIGGGILLVLVAIALVAVLAIVDLFGRDFLVPVMAFEDVGSLEGWERLREMMGAEKLAYAGYVLMKIVLAMGGAIIFSIIDLIVILILLIPLGLLGLAGYFIGKGAGFTWDISTELLLAALGLLVLAGILYVVGFVYAPGLVFFQSYTLEFFAPRYGPLGSKMSPASAPVGPLTSPIAPIPPIAPLVPGDAFPGSR